MLDDSSRIIIICTGNSCRSQMAEGFFRAQLLRRGLRNAAATVRSAGLETHGVNPRAIAVMAESGIDISQQTSNDIQEYLGESFDFVITVCDNAEKSCPIFPGGGQPLHWPFEDPARAEGSDPEVLQHFRQVRDAIETKITNWLEQQRRNN